MGLALFAGRFVIRKRAFFFHFRWGSTAGFDLPVLLFSLRASCVYQGDFYVSILRILFPRTITREGNLPRVMYIRFLVVDGTMKFEVKSTRLEMTSWAFSQ